MQTFLDVRLRQGHVERSLWPLLPVSQQKDFTFPVVKSKRHEAINCNIIARPPADNVGLSVLRSLTRAPSSFVFKVTTRRGCKIRPGTLNRKRRELPNKTGTHPFVSSTRESISFLYPSVTRCLPSFVWQRGAVRFKSFLSMGQQHQAELGQKSSSF